MGIDLINVKRICEYIKERSRNKIIIVASHEKILSDKATKVINFDDAKSSRIINFYKNLKN